MSDSFPGKEKTLTPTLLATVFLTCFGSSLLMGYNLGVTNLPSKHVICFLSKSVLDGSDCGSTGSSNNKNETKVIDGVFLYAQSNTVFVVAAALGAFSCGWVADILGRRGGLLANHVFGILGGLISAPCVLTSSAAMLFVGRFLSGLNSGVTIGVASLYLTEISPRKLRGMIGACHQLAVTIGIVLAYVFTLTSTLNTENLWPLAIGLGAIPAIISLITLPFCPESPRFLFIKKSKEEAARQAFVRLNAKEDVNTFIGELREEIEVAKNQPEFKFSQLFTQRDLRMPILIACLIQVMQQLSGINAVISYSSTMMRTAGVPSEYSEFCVLAIGVLNVAFTVVSLPMLERFGRRTLLLWPTVSLAICLLVLTITVNLVTLNGSETSTGKAMGILSACVIFGYTISFAMGLGPVPALIVAEIFRQGPRAAAYSVSQSIQWISNLIVLFSYPKLDQAIKGFSFLPFFVVVVCCWVFFFLFMPETRNRTFDEVARDLAFGNVVVGKRTARLEDRNMVVFTKDTEGTENHPGVSSQGISRPLLDRKAVNA